MQSKRRFRMTAVACMVAILVGCGGEGEGSSSPSVTPGGEGNASLLAMDGFSVVTPTQSTWVDMSPFIRGGSARITSVDKLSDSTACGDAQVQGSGINVTAASGAFCEYAYTVAQLGASSTTAKLNVLATEAAKPILPPISEALIKGGEAKSFNIQERLGSDWKSTYSLNAETLTVQGMQGNEGSASANGNIITFTPPELSGWSRIVYTLNDSAAPESSVVGVIYVTISEAINQPPSIAQPKYTYSPTTPVLMGEPTTLDLSALPGLNITEPDSQDWQLVSVQSFSATVVSAEPNSVTNKAFTFTAPTIGEHLVSYIIADHYGGYATGLIKIDVKAKGGAPTWTHITQNGLKFTAPLTYTQSQLAEVLTQGVWDAGVTNTIAGFKKNAATQYCASLGSLPLKQSFEAMRAANVSGSTLTGELAKWPKAKPYLVVDGASYKGVELSTGAVTAYEPNEPYYVTCLENNDMSLTMLARAVTANGVEVPVARVGTAKEGETFTLAKLGGSLSEADVNIKVAAVEGRQSTLVASSIKAGDYRFSVTNDDNGSVLESGVLEFVVDAATVTPKPEVLIPTAPVNYLPDTKDEAKVKFTLSDANGNIVASKPITITLSSRTASYRTEPSSGSTDANGVLTVFVKNKEKETVTITPTVTNNKVRTTGETAQVEFVNQFPCQGGGFNCLPVVEDNVPGKLYTPTPEKVFVDAVGFTSNEYYMEIGSYGPLGFHAARMDWNKVNDWCRILSTNNHAGRTNWRMPSKDELAGLYDKYRNMFSALGWPTYDYYWSATIDGSAYYSVSLNHGHVSSNPSFAVYASCVSNPPADLDSAHFDATSGLVIDKNYATSNGEEYNQLTATLTDAHGVPVQGVQVTVSLTEGGSVADSAKVTYHPQVTNEEGKAIIRITNTEKERVSVKVMASVGEVVVESTAKEVAFIPVSIITDRFPCPGGGFNCLPVVEDNVPGKLYTSSPEKVFVEAVEFTPDTYYTENGSNGPSDFQSARMIWDEVNAWCRTLTTIKHAGRTNWRMPSKDELVGLYDKYRNMFSARGWPTNYYYWSATAYGSHYYIVNLYNGDVLSGGNPGNAIYASCVSNP
ncbi:Ig-like domain-containing protein [Vibrio vulnificus]|uniref:Ig-like domain-containing protein n=1 Tax=Vibrio vulnificus TaxID=672 RepID=UPI0013EEBC68|nr:DUF1566 domain-containing protein [Vibrio vulnificus]